MSTDSITDPGCPTAACEDDLGFQIVVTSVQFAAGSGDGAPTGRHVKLTLRFINFSPRDREVDPIQFTIADTAGGVSSPIAGPVACDHWLPINVVPGANGSSAVVCFAVPAEATVASLTLHWAPEPQASGIRLDSVAGG